MQGEGGTNKDARRAGANLEAKGVGGDKCEGRTAWVWFGGTVWG